MRYSEAELLELRKRGAKNAAKVHVVSTVTRTDGVRVSIEELRGETRSARQKPAPYVPLHLRPEVVALGREYDDVLELQVDLERRLKRIAYLNKLKYPTEAHADEAQQQTGAAEELQSMVDKFWELHGSKTDAELRSARAAYKRSLKSCS